MIELCCRVFSQKTGEEVFHGFKDVTAKFENLDDFYSYMELQYGFNTREHHFLISGKDC